MLLATALALLITGCAQQTFTVQNKPAAVAKYHPSFLRFWVGRRKLSMQPKFVAAQKMLKRNPANIRKWIAPVFYFLGIYTLRWKRVCIAHNNYMIYRYGQLYHYSCSSATGSFQLFLHSDQPLSRVK